MTLSQVIFVQVLVLVSVLPLVLVVVAVQEVLIVRGVRVLLVALVVLVVLVVALVLVVPVFLVLVEQGLVVVPALILVLLLELIQWFRFTKLLLPRFFFSETLANGGKPDHSLRFQKKTLFFFLESRGFFVSGNHLARRAQSDTWLCAIIQS